MQVVEVTQTVPPTGSETIEAPKAQPQEQPVKDDESRNVIRQIRNITAFGDCV